VNRILLRSLVSLSLLLASALASAQFAQRGSIAGTVFDQSGAVLPGVQVTLLDIAQKQTSHVKADTAGHFEFNDLTAGQYQLTASEQGFETAQSTSVTVNIGAITTYNFRLHPGSVNETVTVSAQQVGLETDQVGIDTNISTRQMEDLPLNGRNFTSVMALVPGVSTYPQQNINPGGTYSVGAQFAMGGTQVTAGGAFEGSRDNGFYINGVNINDNYESSISYEPSAEAIGTATMTVTDFSAAIGHDISALNIQTKGGTNKFHGEAYDFLENTDLNATNPYNKLVQVITATPFTKPSIIRNQVGGNLGGPIFIPRLLPALRDRLFFFVNYEDLIEHDGNALVTASVPSSAERTGDYSELLGSNPDPQQLYNPFDTTYDAGGNSTRPAIPNNRLDLATRSDGSPLIDPNAVKLVNAAIPLPNVANVPSNETNFVGYQTQGVTNYHLDTRFDARITGHDSVFVTWSKSNGSSNFSGGPQPSQLYTYPTQDQSYLVTVNYAHIFTPNLTNEFIFGVGDATLLSITSGQLAWYNSAANPFNQLLQNTGTGLTHGVMALFISGYSLGQGGQVGNGEIFSAQNKSYQYSDNLNWVRARHTISAGFNLFRKSEIDWDIQENSSFTGEFSKSGGSQGYIGGDASADTMMGLPDSIWVRYQIAGGGPTAPDYNIIFPYYGLYVNDMFRINPKITISAGLRYDLSIPDYTPNPSVAPCCAIYEPNSAGGVLAYPGIAPGLPIHYLSADKKSFAPRLSLIYSPTPRRVIRAGYGIFFDTGSSEVSNLLGTAIYGTSAAVNYSVDNVTIGAQPDTPVLTLSNIFPTPQATTLGSFAVSTGKGQGYPGAGLYTTVTYADQKSAPLPYYQRMVLDVQQALGTRDVVTVSYSGAQGRRGIGEENINLPPYQTGWIYGGGAGDPTFNAARPNNSGRFGDIFVYRPKINAFYNSLIAQYRHEFSRGFQFMSNYTWGKTVSDYPYINSLGENGANGGGTSGFIYPNLYDRGESNQSHRHRLVYSGIWSPQYGQSWRPWARLPLAGWRFSGIGTMESGDALTVSNGGPGTPCPTTDTGTSTCPTGYGSSAQDGAGFDELNVSGNPNTVSHFSKTPFRQFDTSKFSVPPMNVRGNSGLGTVRGPGQNNVDLSLAKTFPLSETFHVEFRGDAFNAFNHSQWNGVITTYPTGSSQFPFGMVTGAREARIGQVAAKIVF
jgi:hypothetical protein